MQSLNDKKHFVVKKAIGLFSIVGDGAKMRCYQFADYASILYTCISLFSERKTSIVSFGKDVNHLLSVIRWIFVFFCSRLKRFAQFCHFLTFFWSTIWLITIVCKIP